MQKLLFMLCLCASFSADAQIFETNFPAYSALYGISPTTDGNFVIVGAKGNSESDCKVWLAKCNATGQLLWEKTYTPAGSSSKGHSVTQAADGGFVITGGYGGSSPSYYEGSFVLKTASQGSPVWSKSFAGTLYCAAQTSDGQWLLGGNTDNYYSGKGVVYRLNNNGNVLWQHEYPAYYYRGHIMRIFPQADGSFYAAGRGEVTGAGFEGIFLINAKSNGDTLWQRGWDTGNYYQDMFLHRIDLLGAVQASNGDMLIADGSGSGKAVLLRYNAQGVKTGETYFGGADENLGIIAMEKDASGNVYLAGTKQVGGYGVQDYFLLKATENGTEQWSHTYPETGTDRLTGVAVRPDGSCLAVGQHSIQPLTGAYLAGYDSDGYRDQSSVSFRLLRDLDGNCSPGAADAPLSGWNILLNGGADAVLISDVDGNASKRIPPGTYTVEVQSLNPHWEVCQPPSSITIDSNSVVDYHEDLVIRAVDNCPVLSVSLTSPDLVRCQRSVYYVECRNVGTASATGAFIRLKMDPSLSPVSASIPYTTDAGAFLFQLGDIPALGSRRFSVTVQLSCDAVIGQTHCVEVEAFPQSGCALKPGAGWSGASLKLNANCNGGIVHFEARNTGSGDMSAALPYEIYTDGCRRQTGQLQLNAGQSWSLDYPAEGRSIWMIAQQEPGHPGDDRPGAGWEGCGVLDNGFISTGFLDMFEHNGRNPQRSYACVENTRIPMPDRVAGIPEGYGWYHLTPFETNSEYVLRVRNPLPVSVEKLTFNIQLTQSYDPASFSVTAASHDYLVRNRGEGKFEVVFEHAGLPPQSQDSLMSQAFLRIKAKFDPAQADTGVYMSVDAQVKFEETAAVSLNAAYQYAVPAGFGIAEALSPYSDAESIKVYHGSSLFDFSGDVVQNPDGTLFYLLTTWSYGTDYDLVLLKTDAQGKGIWQKTYDFGGGEVFNLAVPDGQGGFVATGYQDDPAIPDNYSNDAYLPVVRIDADGNVLWFKRQKPGLGNTGSGAVGAGIIRSGDGHFLITGVVYNGTSNVDDFLWKLDPNGNTVWFQNYFVPGVAMYPAGVVQTPDGGYLIAGNNDSDWPNSTRFEKVDANGDTMWSVQHPFIDYDNTPNGMSGFAMTPDGGFGWLGFVSTYDADSNYVYRPMITRLDANGQVLWRKSIEIGLSVYPADIISLPDGGFLFTGDIITGNTQGSIVQAFLAATDVSGNLLWWNTYDAHTYTAGEIVHPRAGGGYVLTAQTQTSNYLYNLAGVLVFADSNGVLQAPIPEQLDRSEALMIWPNPAHGFFNTRIVGQQAAGPFNWRLLDISGKLVEMGMADKAEFTVPCPQGVQGIYMLEVRWKGGWVTRPVMLSGR